MVMDKNLLSFPPGMKRVAISSSFAQSTKFIILSLFGLMDEVILLLVYKLYLWIFWNLFKKNGSAILAICFLLILVKYFPVLFYIVLKMTLCP